MKETCENLEYSRDTYPAFGGETEIQDVAHTESSIDSRNAGAENRSNRPEIPLAKPRTARYSIDSKPAGPLPQGMLTSAGLPLRGGC